MTGKDLKRHFILYIPICQVLYHGQYHIGNDGYGYPSYAHYHQAKQGDEKGEIPVLVVFEGEILKLECDQR